MSYSHRRRSCIALLLFIVVVLLCSTAQAFQQHSGRHCSARGIQRLHRQFKLHQSTKHIETITKTTTSSNVFSDIIHKVQPSRWLSSSQDFVKNTLAAFPARSTSRESTNTMIGAAARTGSGGLSKFFSNFPLPDIFQSWEGMLAIPVLGVVSLVLFEGVKTMLEKKSPYDSDIAPVYDPHLAEEYFRQRPWLLLTRLMRIFFLTSGFNVRLLLDWQTGKLKEHETFRAKEALHILSKLGPTFVKLGQALSIRTDLIPDAYAKELRKLQDAVPPFDNDLAKTIMKQELGVDDLKDVFVSLSSQPVASASIGQVYRAKLLNGQEVAVKVQRPAIIEEIALDLYLMRLIAPLQVKLSNLINGHKTVPQDLALGLNLVDEWGRGLVAEVDYHTEAKNTKQFVEAMQKRGLHAITSPQVVEELSTSKVLVTEWITGTRLDRDSSADVPRLCGLALNAYLTMLLDTGVLHCDPHPGNLLRTQDGKLCILDWGMTVSLPKDLQYGLLEFISHVNAGDFHLLPEDFVKLGATPADKLEDVKHSGIVEGFAFIMKQLDKGGGPMKITDNLRSEFKSIYGDLSDAELSKKAREEMLSRRERIDNNNNSVDHQAVEDTAQPATDISGAAGLMEMISKKNREIFQVPSYMLYIVRAFSVLEGIGLSIDPNYSILQECYPYLAKRLMTDDSPRSREALRNMIMKNGQLKTDKLIEFSQGFQSYTASTTNVDPDGVGTQQAKSAFTELLLDSKGNMVQELLLESMAKFADSLLRVGINRIKASRGGKLAQFAVKAPKTLIDMFVPHELKPLLLPFTLPYDISKAIVNLVEQDDNDTANVQSLRILWKNLEPRMRGQVRDLMKGEKRNEVLIPMSLVDSKKLRRVFGNTGGGMKLNEKIPVMIRMTRRLGANMLNTAAERMEATAKHSLQYPNTNNNQHTQQQHNAQSPLSSIKLMNYQQPPQSPSSSANNAKASSADHDDLDYDIEVILTEQLGTLTSVTAKSMARIIDSKPKKTKE